MTIVNKIGCDLHHFLKTQFQDNVEAIDESNSDFSMFSLYLDELTISFEIGHNKINRIVLNTEINDLEQFGSCLDEIHYCLLQVKFHYEANGNLNQIKNTKICDLDDQFSIKLTTLIK